jgi:NADH-quinone oxidoreductase subunit N
MPGFQVGCSDIIGVLPLLILFGTALIVLMWDAFEKRPSRAPLVITILGAVGAAIAAFVNLDNVGRVFGGMILDDSYAHYYAILFCVAVILTVLLAERYLKEEEILVGEFSALILFSACGMIMLASSMDLIVTFLGLETMSIAFYVLAGLFRRKERSNEAALKYFLLGSFAAGFFLYGIALIYGSVGSTNLDTIRIVFMEAKSAAIVLGNPIFWVGVAMLLVGFAFKIAAFPFHQWAPDVYEGAPTIVTGFMSTAGKAGAFAALALIFDITFAPLAGDPVAGAKLRTVLAVLSLGSMFYGNITAIAQTNLKRMLAYSSIAHAGYMLLGVAALSPAGVRAVAIYLTVYTLMQIGAFGVIAILEKDTGAGLELSDYVGLAKRRPWLAFFMSIMMLSLAGIPPFGGFFGKYYIFSVAIGSGLTMYAILGVIASLISVYFYLRVIVLMYFREPEHSSIAGQVEVVGGGTIAMSGARSAWLALLIAAIGLLVTGVMPNILASMVQKFFAH